MVDDATPGKVRLSMWRDKKVVAEDVMDPEMALLVATWLIHAVPADRHERTHDLVADAINESRRRAGYEPIRGVWLNAPNEKDETHSNETDERQPPR